VGMRRRVSVLEDFIEKRVEERLEQELERMLDRLEHGLSRDEFVRVLEIVSKEGERGR
jgi:hypothetical protein